MIDTSIYKFSSILIDKEGFKNYKLYNGKEDLEGLSSINFFVGANNSGKSRLLRAIYQNQDLKFTTKEFPLSLINKPIEEFKRNYEGSISQNRHLQQLYDQFSNDYDNLTYFPHLEKVVDLKDHLKALRNFQSIFQHYSEIGLLSYQASEVLKKLIDLIPKNSSFTRFEFNNIYIPILRGLRPIVGKDDTYNIRTQQDYFNSNDASPFIFTGLNLYIELDKLFRGSPAQKKKLVEYENFLSENFFKGKKVYLTPRYESSVVYVRIGDNDDIPIYNLGDGIQASIILTYPLFFNDKSSIKVFIEEPEMHLHPGFQRVFIDTLLLPRFNNFQFFITTHSNHFLDMTLNSERISIYTVEKLEDSTSPNFLITNVENGDTNILKLLGIQTSSVFLSNCTIWVEGITDRIYVRKYLEIYQKNKSIKFSEDIDFSFVEYSGNNITHWSFLDSPHEDIPNIQVERLCGKLFLITDNDNADFTPKGEVPVNPSKKALRFKQLKEKLGDRFYCLSRREIENLITPQILNKVVVSLDKKGVDIDTSDINYSSYKNAHLGEYLDKTIKRGKKKYSGKTGTINDKTEFALRATEFMEEEKDLSIDALALAEGIYKFIEINSLKGH